jgi:hypothetical protein
MIKFIYDNETDIPEALKAYYKKGDDGKFTLQAEGAVSRVKLEEFRDKNVQLLKAAEAFKDIDPAEFARLKGIESELESGKLKGTAIEKILEKRVEEMTKAHNAAVAKLTGDLGNAKGELSRLKIGEAAVSSALKLGLRAEAREDLITRVSNVFRLDDKGEPVAFDGDKPKFGADGMPLKIGDFVESMVKAAPHLFDPSSGSGSGGSGGGGGGGGGVNPWKKESFNITEQGRIFAKDPAKARQLAEAAGYKL